MATHYELYERGATCGLRYRFDKAGDGIAMHAHAPLSMRHNTVCIKGAVEIYGDCNELLLEAGEVATYPSHRQHEIRALEDGSEIINVFLHGRPHCYEGVPAERLAGSVDSIMQGRYATDI